ncbi:MAG: PadR family transcriptional regulator [Leptolyngbya sp.]|nr:PadR family transcriptional regulator [Leptolyngbya sp.]
MALAHAILVSLLDRPSSGYDLAKQFDGSVGCFWDASHQQIYRELAKLEAVGRIQAQSIQRNTRPNKIIYGITPQGEAWLKPWLAEPVTLAPVKDSLWVKLFGGISYRWRYEMRSCVATKPCPKYGYRNTRRSRPSVSPTQISCCGLQRINT